MGEELPHWTKYFDTVGREGDDLSAMLKNLEGQGFTIKADVQASVDVTTKTITYGADTKKWELLEEFAHVRVSNGWMRKEIEQLTAELSKSRNIQGKWIRPKKAAKAAEEIIVKKHLLETASSLGAAERELLESQINRLRIYGYAGY